MKPIITLAAIYLLTCGAFAQLSSDDSITAFRNYYHRNSYVPRTAEVSGSYHCSDGFFGKTLDLFPDGSFTEQTYSDVRVPTINGHPEVDTYIHPEAGTYIVCRDTLMLRFGSPQSDSTLSSTEKTHIVRDKVNTTSLPDIERNWQRTLYLFKKVKGHLFLINTENVRSFIAGALARNQLPPMTKWKGKLFGERVLMKVEPDVPQGK